MKKIFGILFMILSIAAVCFTLVACADAGAPKYDTSDPQFDISVETLENKLEDFLADGRVDRTMGTEAEWHAADYIENELLSYGYAEDDVDAIEFSVVVSSTSTFYSRHVTAVHRSGVPDAKNVIVGAYYDNCYALPVDADDPESILNYSNGALANGTGVATLLAIAEYFKTNDLSLDFDVTFVFFGASATSNVGVSRFIDSLDDEIANIVCMIELDRIGADNVYAFSDARPTKREELFGRVAQENKLNIYSVTQKSPYITGMSALNGVPYYHWAMGALYPTFFNHGIPTLGIIGGNWETFGFADNESYTGENVAFTQYDTLENLERIHPDYGTKMATATTLVTKSLTDGQFLSVVTHDRANFPNTDILTKAWVWDLIVIGVLVLAAIGLTAVAAYLGKKYKPVTIPPKNIKMAVFGVDYEDKNSDNIYIDIKQVSNPFDDIFPGIPNNDRSGAQGGTAPDNNDPFSDYPDPPKDE
ncbi:MAG: M28 family peptidase [Clostridiales bacterium]|nr:M28 family peptidase [Clostridiales bacterium]